VALLRKRYRTYFIAGSLISLKFDRCSGYLMELYSLGPHAFSIYSVYCGLQTAIAVVDGVKSG
jgi:hypothetical protein